MGLGLTGLLGTGPARAADRFVVPAEDAPHDRTFMQWPVSRRVYPPRAFRTAVQDTIIDLANIVAAFEPVTLLAAADHHAVLRARLSGAVTLWDIPTEDLWCRDTGPIFAVNSAGDLAVQHIQFNGWGEKQVNRRGSQIAANVAARLSVPLLPTGLTGEGGGVEQDGHGLLMAHESSWVNANRNPGLTKAEVTDKLLSAYGADRMVWAPGLCGEDITDYHIDSLARFTGPGQVLMNLPLDPDLHDPFHQTARQTHDVLKDAGLTVDVIPEPVRRRVQSWDFVASYVNFYVCNGAVIAAEFGDPDTDAQARDALSAAYPGREIVMINADVLGEIGGGIHCATQQMPAV
ncbi:MAG: agmatine deiminase family protein [Pseudomonadota bacterium]